MDKNSLASLIGQYSSDSENDEDKQSNLEGKSFKRKFSPLLLRLPITNWTECIDKATNHPYYWNVDTKEVTWERPKEYDDYLQCLVSSEIKIPRNSWIRGYSDGSDNPYYVNEYTRVVVWEKPPEFKEPDEIDKRILPNGTASSFKMKFKELIADEEKKFCEKKIYSDEDKDYKNTILLEDKCIQKNLVAAYTTDDSDFNDEDEQEDTEENLKTISSVKAFANIITGSNTETSFDEEIDKLKRELDESSSTSCNSELNQNSKFIESLICDDKTFQRKKRIEFNTSRKVGTEATTHPILLETVHTDSAKEKGKNIYTKFQKSHLEFDKSDTKKEFAQTSKNIGTDEINGLSNLILEKVSFLSIGHPKVSAVQAINIQLKTLLTAFQVTALDQEFLFQWLKTTSDELLKLEQNAVPNGWNCTWDRTRSQYCYTNLKTNEIQWDFPINDKSQYDLNPHEMNRHTSEDVLCGGDEMDISTTPPPNADEQLHATEQTWNESNPPPPPIISDANKGNFSCELASFYQDIAALETQPAVTTSVGVDCSQFSDTDSTAALSPSLLDQFGKKRSIDNEYTKKKKHKIKVQRLGSKMKEVSEMVANWKKAQQELEN